MAEASAARGDVTGLHAYLRLAVEREQARRAEDLLARRLRVGLLQDGLMKRLLPAATAALGAALPLSR
jgi:glycerol-3-phosphate dehydrogenase